MAARIFSDFLPTLLAGMVVNFQIAALALLLGMLLGLLLNITLIEYAGFILSSTLLFLCTARAFGSEQPARDAAIGFALAFVAYVGFDRLLGYKIGSGLIESLF